MVKQRAVNAGDYSIVLPASAPTEASFLAVGADLNAYWQPVNGASSPQLPTHLYAFYAEDASGSSWASKTGAVANTLTHQNGGFSIAGVGTDRAVAFAGNTNWASFSASPAIAAFAAILKLDPLGFNNFQLACFGHTAQVSAVSGGRLSSSTLSGRNATVIPANFRTASVYAGSTLLGQATGVTLGGAGIHDQWGLMILNGLSPLFPYNNIGNDRGTWGMRGSLKALVGFASPLSSQEIANIADFLKGKYGMT